MTRLIPSDDELHAYVDERLEPVRRAEVQAWLAANPQAAARVEGWRAGRQDEDDRVALALAGDEAIALGDLCAMADADRSGVVAIRNTLQALDGPESAPEGAAENAIVKRLQGTPIMLPEGINPLELLAPRLLKD